MRRIIGIATVVFSVMFSGFYYAEDAKTFTVTGEWIVLGSDTTTDGEETITSLVAFVEVARTVVDEEGTLTNLTIASGSFSNGSVVLEGEIEERTDVLISVQRADEEPMTLPAVLVPSENTSFALVDNVDLEDELMLIENFRIAEKSDAKFMITGDFNSIKDKDLSVAVAYIRVQSNNPKDGSVLSDKSNAVLLRNGRFSIEGIASEPLLVDVWVKSRIEWYTGVTRAVVEPGARIKIFPGKSSSSFAPGGMSSLLVAHSEVRGSMHAKIIESWQSSSEYLEKMDEYAHSIEVAAQHASSDTDIETDQSTTDVSEQQFVRDPYDVFEEMEVIRNSTITDIAENWDWDDPVIGLLAMELGALYGLASSRQLETWNKLASVLDGDLVRRRVSPHREALELIKIAEASNTTSNAKTAKTKSIIEGKQAPEFTLANLDGEDVELYDVLAENDVVLIDFWASWCAPCIASIPKLKELYADYNEKGFEIMFVSIDDTHEEWKEESVKQELPWINVGDINGFEASTALDWEITSIPTEFLIDPKGKILDRDVTPDELESLLIDRFGDKNKQENVEDSTTTEGL